MESDDYESGPCRFFYKTPKMFKKKYSCSDC